MALRPRCTFGFGPVLALGVAVAAVLGKVLHENALWTPTVVLIGLTLPGFVVDALRSGVVGLYKGSAARATDPTDYWIGIGVWVFVSLMFLALTAAIVWRQHG